MISTLVTFLSVLADVVIIVALTKLILTKSLNVKTLIYGKTEHVETTNDIEGRWVVGGNS
jgi:hypothetical protein